MNEMVRSSVRMVKKGKRDGFVFECPINLTEDQKIQYAKDKYHAQMKKRAYKFEYEILIP